jgi:hypothetical protein
MNNGSSFTNNLILFSSQLFINSLYPIISDANFAHFSVYFKSDLQSIFQNNKIVESPIPGIKIIAQKNSTKLKLSKILVDISNSSKMAKINAIKK